MFPSDQEQKILGYLEDSKHEELSKMPVDKFVDVSTIARLFLLAKGLLLTILF